MEEDDIYVVITSYGASPKFKDETMYHSDKYESLLIPSIDIFKLSKDEEKE